jgi:predicted HicB family RNase H-like nuclease
MPVSKKQQKSVNKYIEKSYDRINLTVKKGGKQKLHEAATAKELSINGYIKKALKSQLLIDLRQDVDL